MTVHELLIALEQVPIGARDIEVRIESIDGMSSSTPVEAYLERNVEPNRESVFVIEV